MSIDPMLLWTMLKQFLLLSLLSIGGANTTIPEFHRFLVLEHGWLSESRFVELYALSQAAPGPNMLFVALFGLQIAGLNLSARLLEPVAHQVCAAGDLALIHFAQQPCVGGPQFTLHFFVAEKRGVADNDIRLRPFGHNRYLTTI